MKCSEVITQLKDVLSENQIVVSSNGNISRIVYNIIPIPQLYLRGSMGLLMAVGLGIALSQPNKTIIVVTGDGNFLMGLSSLTTISYLSPSNLKIIILDNESYATTGGQETVSKSIHYTTMIKGMGIKSVRSINTLKFHGNLEELLSQIIQEPGLRVLHIKVEKEAVDLENIPFHPVEIYSNFKKQHQIARGKG